MNEVILGRNDLVMKRLWNLDTNTRENGEPDKKTKEMLGLVVRRGRSFAAMIVSGTTWVNVMNWELRRPSYTRSLQRPILSVVQL